ncbi:hypothetical protein CDD82_589 [Ophiocordyceps australis]|uniref:Uncharacterized protein n=1 Tax=Ophiocordyceps australis TaxID=1399860 RepID=A0A2C5YLA6_9HYPO|nr:hypothetical protein CDD82_589 [Ophiocordyceps australis]
MDLNSIGAGHHIEPGCVPPDDDDGPEMEMWVEREADVGFVLNHGMSNDMKDQILRCGWNQSYTAYQTMECIARTIYQLVEPTIHTTLMNFYTIGAHNFNDLNAYLNALLLAWSLIRVVYPTQCESQFAFVAIQGLKEAYPILYSQWQLDLASGKRPTKAEMVEWFYQQLAFERHTQQLALEAQYQQLAFATQYQQFSLGTHYQQFSLEAQNQQFSLATQNQQFSLDTQNQPFSLDTQNQQLSLDTQNQQLSLDTQNQQLSLDTQNQQLSLDTQNQQLSLDTQNQQPSLDTQNQQLSLDTQNQQLSLDTQNQQHCIENGGEGSSTPQAVPNSQPDNNNFSQLSCGCVLRKRLRIHTPAECWRLHPELKPTQPRGREATPK